MNNDKSIEVLNKLLEINNDRLEGYETALNETEEHDIKTLFAQLARTSHRNRKELAAEITNLGGNPTEGTRTSGKIFRAWMDVKVSLSGEEREAIITSCEFGEDKAIETYEDVLKNDMDQLNANHQALIQAQYALLKDDHDLVHSLRDALSGRIKDTSQRSRVSC